MTLTSSETDNLLELYQQDSANKIVTIPEVTRWKEKWNKRNVTILQTNATDALEIRNADLFPNVRKLLTILETLPATTAASELS